jgi:hypothetical protein
LLVEANNALGVIEYEGRKGTLRVELPQLIEGLLPILAIQQVKVRIVIADVKVLQESLCFLAPNTGAQSIQSQVPITSAFYMSHFHNNLLPVLSAKKSLPLFFAFHPKS